MSDMIIHEPLASQLREAAAKSNTAPEALVAELLQNWERQHRLEEFRKNARLIGEDIEKLGWSEADLEAHIEAVRQRLHEEDYGKSAPR